MVIVAMTFIGPESAASYLYPDASADKHSMGFVANNVNFTFGLHNVNVGIN